MICFSCHAPDETHKVKTLRFVVHYFVILFAGIFALAVLSKFMHQMFGFLTSLPGEE